jgi:hypothetical protein
MVLPAETLEPLSSRSLGFLRDQADIELRISEAEARLAYVHARCEALRQFRGAVLAFLREEDSETLPHPASTHPKTSP